MVSGKGKYLPIQTLLTLQLAPSTLLILICDLACGPAGDSAGVPGSCDQTHEMMGAGVM